AYNAYIDIITSDESAAAAESIAQRVETMGDEPSAAKAEEYVNFINSVMPVSEVINFTGMSSQEEAGFLTIMLLPTLLATSSGNADMFVADDAVATDVTIDGNRAEVTTDDDTAYFTHASGEWMIDGQRSYAIILEGMKDLQE